MIGDFLDRLGTFVQANLKLCIATAALVTILAIVLNAQAETKNSVWMHIATLGGMALGTFLMVLSGRAEASMAEAAEEDGAETDSLRTEDQLAPAAASAPGRA